MMGTALFGRVIILHSGEDLIGLKELPGLRLQLVLGEAVGHGGLYVLLDVITVIARLPFSRGADRFMDTSWITRSP